MLYLASQFVGATPIPFRATLFEKSEQMNWLVAWHQDVALPIKERFDDPDWGPWSVKDGVQFVRATASALERVIALRLHLDDSTSTNGPLRVIPASHRGGLLSAEQISERAAVEPPLECTVPSGGVIAMRPLLIHASSKSTDNRPRRVLHIEYADSLILSPGIELAIA
jgi:ectoine hydroxylase-related dioxygenase (phytanoyl-CoA dioxygenase family)